MKKVLKRTLLVLLILIVLIIAALIIIPVVFKPQLKRIAEKEIFSRVNAKIEFKDFQVSMIKGFPNLYIGLKNLTLVGLDNFNNDTLVAFDELSVKVDLISVFKMKNIEVKSVLLNRPRFNARFTNQGKANWDITKPSIRDKSKPSFDSLTNQQTTNVTTGVPLTMKFALCKFEIRNASIKYINDSSKILAVIRDLNLKLSGNLGGDFTDLKIKSSIDALTFEMRGIRYLSKVKMSFTGAINADMVNHTYTFKDNEFSLNAIILNFAGIAKVLKDDIAVDVKFNSDKTDFKSILSLVPAIYMQGYEGLQASGKLKLSGFVKGIYNGKIMPNANVELLLENAMFKYPALTKSADNINVDTKVNFDGTNMNNTTIDVNRFHIELAGNPFDAGVHISTPISDMQIAGFLKGRVDFTSLSEVIPLKNMKISGLLESDIQIGGRMSFIKKQQFDSFKANGTMKFSNFEFTIPNLPKGFKIIESTMNFSSTFVDLVSFDSRIGKSDFRIAGRLENFIPYIFNNETVRGNLNLTSNLLDINELRTPKEIPIDTTKVSTTPTKVVALPASTGTADIVKTNTPPVSVVEIPKNVDFAMKVAINHILYDKIDISNFNGKLSVKYGKVFIDNLYMNMLDGTMLMSGEYNPSNIKKPTVAFEMKVTEFDIPSTIRSFSPSAKEVKGKFSTQLTIAATLDTTMSPINNSIKGNGKLQSDNIELPNSKIFGKVADFLKNDALRNPDIKDLNFSFTINDGRIYIDPFNTKIADFGINIGGDMGLDQTLNFKAKMSIPRAKLGPVNDIMDNLLSLAASKGININVRDVINLNLKIGGTTADPEVMPEWGGSGDDAKEVVKEETKVKSKEDGDKLIADAVREAERQNAEAALKADKIRNEAKENADKLEAEGNKSGGFAAQAAKFAAKQIRAAGEIAARKVIADADAKGKAAIEKAKQDATK